jgi:hypothetical protein
MPNIAFPNETWKRITVFSILKNPYTPCPIQNPKSKIQNPKSLYQDVHNLNGNAI